MEDYKAKYEEALEKARQFSEKPLQEDSSNIVEYIFPELAESEDERIRKDIIIFISFYADNEEITTEQRETLNSWIAWLEKQGEQKPVDTVIPFGAKDSELIEETYHIPDGYHAEINSNTIVIKKGEHKPTEWSKEDIRHIKTIMILLEGEKIGQTDGGLDVLNKEIAWLKSIKDRCVPQKHWKPSEEQLDALLFAEGYIRGNHTDEIAKELASLYEQLNALQLWQQ